jgi:hypothetical protein
MSRSAHKNAKFKKEVTEAMDISPSRRAREQRETLMALMDFITIEEKDESGDTTFIRQRAA